MIHHYRSCFGPLCGARVTHVPPSLPETFVSLWQGVTKKGEIYEALLFHPRVIDATRYKLRLASSTEQIYLIPDIVYFGLKCDRNKLSCIK